MLLEDRDHVWFNYHWANAQLSLCSHCSKYLLNKSSKNWLILIHKLYNHWNRRSVHPYLLNRSIFTKASVYLFTLRLHSLVWTFSRAGKSFLHTMASSKLYVWKQSLLTQHANIWICSFAIDNSRSQNLTRYSSQALIHSVWWLIFIVRSIIAWKTNNQT